MSKHSSQGSSHESPSLHWPLGTVPSSPFWIKRWDYHQDLRQETSQGSHPHQEYLSNTAAGRAAPCTPVWTAQHQSSHRAGVCLAPVWCPCSYTALMGFPSLQGVRTEKRFLNRQALRAHTGSAIALVGNFQWHSQSRSFLPPPRTDSSSTDSSPFTCSYPELL